MFSYSNPRAYLCCQMLIPVFLLFRMNILNSIGRLRPSGTRTFKKPSLNKLFAVDIYFKEQHIIIIKLEYCMLIGDPATGISIFFEMIIPTMKATLAALTNMSVTRPLSLLHASISSLQIQKIWRSRKLKPKSLVMKSTI